MKRFDLEAAKRGDPIVCRNGTPAHFIAYGNVDHAYSVVVKVRDRIEMYTNNGSFINGDDRNGFDLFMVSEEF